ncbi:MAG TPA: 23S rRNA (adenine(2030)-N(6))-methyltransferase RlmJ, partial [Pseudomonadota bacterium]|nr:23S rRNA (adenine(2030)-N(6))-methyltransferase RlmJ [Pseudomonadota bacterium]
MNYRHVYHAGNFADVLKHVVLIALIEALKTKQTPFAVLDTHAGAGRYSLASEEALKTGEFRDGVMRLLAAERLPTLVHAYLNLVRSQNGSQSYPGSPLIAAQLLRDSDRLMVCELQNAEIASLRQLFARDARVAVHQRDGYQAMSALLPPPEKRGLVLIDPPFEAQEQEFRVIEEALAAAHKRFANGVYAVWYPIKLR